tara:strand:+ start:393 stop:1583 length:1191 start_codon:yes stop_codon:yes gene_type:complete
MTESEWKKVRLTDFVWFQRGFDLPKNKFMPGNIPVYGSTSILGYHNQSKVKGPGIITGRSGTIGKFQYSTGEFWPHNTSLWVKDFKGNSPKFAFYLLNCLDFKSMNTGGAVPTLNRNLLSSFIVDVPSIKTQKKIASILSAYDDLIENNLKRIKLLEEKAQLTYEEWFVRMKYPGHENDSVDSETGLPRGWTKNKFSTHFEIQNGYAFKSEDYRNNGIEILRTKDYSSTKWVNKNDPIYIGETQAKSFRKYLTKPFDLMLIMVGASIGNYGIVLPKDRGMLQNQNQWAIRSKKENLVFYKLVMMERLIASLKSKKTGAARDFFRSSFLKEMNVIIPSESIIKRLNIILEPSYNLINTLFEENDSLISIREILLPRLMSGMIDVNEIMYNYPKEILE